MSPHQGTETKLGTHVDRPLEHRLHITINGWFVGNTTAGSGQYINHLLTHMPRLPKAVRLSLIVPQDLMGKLAESANSYHNVEVVPVHLPALPTALRKIWWEQVSIPQAAKRLHANLLWVPYWAAPAWQPCPVVVTVHDLIPLLLPAYRGGLPHKFYTALVSWTARRSASVITVSHASARDIAQHLHIAPERVHVVYHGPNQEGASLTTATEIGAVRTRYQLPDRYFLYLGGFDMRKNVDSILAAYARYLALGGDPAIRLVIAGQLPRQDSDFAPDPRRQAGQHGVTHAVHFCGRVEEADKAAVYAGATAFLFPSLYEGFGMMLLEAMTAGTPVITSGD